MSDAVTEQVIDALRAERDALKAVVEAVNTEGLTIAVMNAVIERDELKQQVADLTRKLAEATRAIQPS